jgi:hypothetical protein
MTTRVPDTIRPVYALRPSIDPALIDRLERLRLENTLESGILPHGFFCRRLAEQALHLVSRVAERSKP